MTAARRRLTGRQLAERSAKAAQTRKRNKLKREIEDLEKKIRDLQDMAHTLTMLVNACHGDHRPHCPILQELESDPDDEDLSVRPRPGAIGRSLQ